MEERVKLERDGAIAIVTLNRPDKRNALDLKMFHAIIAVQKKLAKQRDLRGVILTGEGVDFCSGIDVKSLMNDGKAAAKLMWKWWPWSANTAQKLCTGWRDLPVPVIAVLNGKVWGGGTQIALGADFRYAAPDCTMSVMESRWGLIPDMGGNLAMREQLGQDHAMWLAMSADVIDAERCRELGLVTEISNDPMVLAKERLEQLLVRSPDVLAATKKLYRRNWSRPNGWMLARETFYQWRLVFGKNRKVAVAKQLGKDRDYAERESW